MPDAAEAGTPAVMYGSGREAEGQQGWVKSGCVGAVTFTSFTCLTH